MRPQQGVRQTPNVRLTLSSRPENVLLARQALRALADTASLDELELTDVSTAVTEACNNVVAHAYGDDAGPMVVEMYCSHEGLQVLVRDHGAGIGPLGPAGGDGEPTVGIGLAVIRALSGEVEFSAPPGGGTEVRMSFPSAKLGGLEQAGDPDEAALSQALPEPDGEDRVAMSAAPAALARGVLRRVLVALAARARFASDRIEGTQQLVDGLVAHLEGSLDASQLSARVGVAPRHIELVVGPLRPGSSFDGLAPLLERLTSGHDVARADSSEVLALRLSEPAPAPRAH